MARKILGGPAIYCVIAVVAFLFLNRMAWRAQHRPVATARRARDIVKTEVLTIYAPDRLIKLASDHGPFRDHDDLALALKRAKLNGYWYAIEIGYTMADGASEISTTVMIPGQNSSQFSSVETVMETLAGRPPASPNLDFGDADILVIDEAYMGGNPMETVLDLDEIRVATHTRPQIGGIRAIVQRRDD